MKNFFSHLPAIANERPLVILFAWERFGLLKMMLPRLVNAVRYVGGYLVAVDDASIDDRVRRMLKEYEEAGWVDFAFIGKNNRHIDWIVGEQWGYGKKNRQTICFLGISYQA